MMVVSGGVWECLLLSRRSFVVGLWNWPVYSEKPIGQIAEDLGISESCLRRWISQADVDVGVKPRLSSDERAELVRLRRENRVQAMEIEILMRASAYFARENVLPK